MSKYKVYHIPFTLPVVKGAIAVLAKNPTEARFIAGSYSMGWDSDNLVAKGVFHVGEPVITDDFEVEENKVDFGTPVESEDEVAEHPDYDEETHGDSSAETEGA